MSEVLEKSPRHLTAELIAETVVGLGLNQPYGGEVGRGHDRKNRAYYSVAFSLPRNLDGIISVYSSKYLVVKYSTRFNTVAPEDTVLFKRVDDLKNFLQAAFVDLDRERAQEIINITQEST